MQGAAPGSGGLGFSWRVAVVGVAILVAAVAAGFFTQPQASSLPVEWDVHRVHPDNATAELDAGEDRWSTTYAVPHANVTWFRVDVQVEVPAGHDGPDTVEVTLLDPTGNGTLGEATLAADARNASLPVNRTIADVPEIQRVETTDRAEARRRLVEDHADPATNGTWRLEVVIDHGGAPSPHRVHVAGTYAYYSAVLGEP